MQGDHATEAGTGTAEMADAVQLWSTAGIAAWSLLFTPAFGAWLQMYNWRRMGDAARAGRAWYWCLGGLAVLGWNAIAYAIGARLGLDSMLFGWVSVALYAAWMIDTWPAHAQAVGKEWHARRVPRAWDSVVVLGLAAALAYLAATAVLALALTRLT
jgi:hypothetical protein